MLHADCPRRPSIALRCCALLILWFSALALAMPAMAQPKFPPLTGRIIDDARILSPVDIQELTATLAQLEGKSSDQIVVYTTPSLQGYEIEDFGYQLGRFWKIGQVGVNNGILLIIAPNEKKVRIEVGRGLEGQMTDLMSGLIVRNAILPAFRRGDFAGGVKAGTRDIKDVLLGDAEAVRDRAKSIKPRQSKTDWVTIAIFFGFIVIWFLVVRAERQQALAAPSRMQRRRRNGDGNVVVIPGGWGGSGGWSGGGSSSSDSGGGFSGGGGDFGGGGASGSW